MGRHRRACRRLAAAGAMARLDEDGRCCGELCVLKPSGEVLLHMPVAGDLFVGQLKKQLRESLWARDSEAAFLGLRLVADGRILHEVETVRYFWPEGSSSMEVTLMVERMLLRQEVCQAVGLLLEKVDPADPRCAEILSGIQLADATGLKQLASTLCERTTAELGTCKACIDLVLALSLVLPEFPPEYAGEPPRTWKTFFVSMCLQYYEGQLAAATCDLITVTVQALGKDHAARCGEEKLGRLRCIVEVIGRLHEENWIPVQVIEGVAQDILEGRLLRAAGVETGRIGRDFEVDVCRRLLTFASAGLRATEAGRVLLHSLLDRLSEDPQDPTVAVALAADG